MSDFSSFDIRKRSFPIEGIYFPKAVPLIPKIPVRHKNRRLFLQDHAEKAQDVPRLYDLSQAPRDPLQNHAQPLLRENLPDELLPLQALPAGPVADDDEM
jgi:hypothetical protein